MELDFNTSFIFYNFLSQEKSFRLRPEGFFVNFELFMKPIAPIVADILFCEERAKKIAADSGKKLQKNFKPEFGY